MPWGVARPRGYSEWAPFGVLVIINYLLKPDYVPGATKAKKRQGPFPGSFPGEERTVLAAKKGFHLKIQWHVTAQGCSMPLLYFYFQWCSFIFLSKSNKVYKIFLQDREKIKLNSIFYHTFKKSTWLIKLWFNGKTQHSEPPWLLLHSILYISQYHKVVFRNINANSYEISILQMYKCTDV